MHGGGGDEKEILCGSDGSMAMKNILDHMIANGELEPLIVAAPTFYPSGAHRGITSAALLTKTFHEELRRDLLPALDQSFRTRTDRSSRAFGGFSMGAEATWEVFLSCLDLVRNYMPLSGDCWILGEKGGASAPEETSRRMKEYLKDKGFWDWSYNIFAFTGNEDIAFPALFPQINAMRKDGFHNGRDKILRFDSWPEGVHTYHYMYQYIYNILPEVIG